ncbi:hypothetical protein P5673_033005 [Acropora cervicornis]|uniref:Endonuclease/exonuclease/phosphatase domain-containing protein n=1 Tax=Acropora cervicornis TaxID=6130 RepID=A0AAD9PQI2_ACRCE|nr:hypothetical protein P5673_033005 [Acropora cervicornis]
MDIEENFAVDAACLGIANTVAIARRRRRRVNENAFGILSSKFRVFLSTLCVKPENAIIIVHAALSLHNYLLCSCPNIYTPPGSVDTQNGEGDIFDGDWRNTVESYIIHNINIPGCNCTRNAASVRDCLYEYVNGQSCFLRRPDDNNFFNIINIILEIAWLKSSNIFLLGDLNCDYSDCRNTNRAKLQCIFDSVNMHNVITNPTRNTMESSTLIDLVVTTRIDLVSTTGVFPLGISDQDLIYATIRLKIKDCPHE